MAMYRTIVALNLVGRFIELYREEERNRTQDLSLQYCFLSSLLDQDRRKGVGAAVVNAIRDKWDFKRACPKRQFLPAFLRIQAEHGNLRVVWIPVDRAKVAVHWISCVRHSKLPDQTQNLWKRFQCSERCTNAACFRNEHICWESAADNQSRGHNLGATHEQHVKLCVFIPVVLLVTSSAVVITFIGQFVCVGQEQIV